MIAAFDHTDLLHLRPYTNAAKISSAVTRNATTMPPRRGAPIGPSPPAGPASVSPVHSSSGVSWKMLTNPPHNGSVRVTRSTRNPASLEMPRISKPRDRMPHHPRTILTMAAGGESSPTDTIDRAACQFRLTSTRTRYSPIVPVIMYALSFEANANANRAAVMYK